MMRAQLVLLLFLVGISSAYWPTTYRPWTTRPWTPWPTHRPWTNRPWTPWPTHRPWTNRPWTPWPTHRPWTNRPWTPWPTHRPWTNRPWTPWPTHRPWTNRPWTPWPTHRPWTNRPWTPWPTHRPWTNRPWTPWPTHRPWTNRPWTPWPTHRPWTNRPWTPWPTHRPWTNRPWTPWPTHRPWTNRPCTHFPGTTQRPWTTSRPDSLQNATCNFDDVPCSFTQDSSDQLDFTIYRGRTPSHATGPSGDHTSGYGRYIYVEASGQRPGSRARMSKYLFLRHRACLFFHYHMYGAAMGSLKVYINDKLVWKLNGNQGDQWEKATFPVKNAGFYRFDFEAVIGDSYTSDIALDDLGYQEYYNIDQDVCDITPSCANPANQPTPSPLPTFPSLPPYQNVSCGRPAIPPARVIGGVDVRPGSWPWQVALKVFGIFICGGSLITPRWVVTAAHCIRQGLSYEIVLGDHNRNINEGTEQSINAANIFVHPNWNRTAIDSDIALIYLSRPAMLNTRVRPVCLPRQGEMVPNGTKCYITGWGKIRHPGSSHPILQQAVLPVVSKKCCQKKFAASPGAPPHMQINDNMICGGKEGSIKSGCHGDSGGPFVCQTPSGRWVLQGVVSWGSPRCDTRERFSVFARVARFRNWIDLRMTSVG